MYRGIILYGPFWLCYSTGNSRPAHAFPHHRQPLLSACILYTRHIFPTRQIKWKINAAPWQRCADWPAVEKRHFLGQWAAGYCTNGCEMTACTAGQRRWWVSCDSHSTALVTSGNLSVVEEGGGGLMVPELLLPQRINICMEYQLISISKCSGRQ